MQILQKEDNITLRYSPDTNTYYVYVDENKWYSNKYFQIVYTEYRLLKREKALHMALSMSRAQIRYLNSNAMHSKGCNALHCASQHQMNTFRYRITIPQRSSRTFIQKCFPSSIHFFLELLDQMFIFRFKKMFESSLAAQEIFDRTFFLWLII